MGLIIDSLKKSDKFVSSSNECSDCSGSRAVAGMENNKTMLTNRDEKGADTAVEKTTEDGKKYILADGPASALFTKALQVKYATGDQQAELNNKRPLQASFKESEREVDNVGINTSNESAAQDTFLQIAQRNRDQQQNSDVELNASRIRVSRTDGNPREPITVNPVHAFKNIAETGVPVDFVFLTSQSQNKTPNNTTEMTNPEVNELMQVNSNTIGRVPGLVANESMEIMSVEVFIRYK